MKEFYSSLDQLHNGRRITIDLSREGSRYLCRTAVGVSKPSMSQVRGVESVEPGYIGVHLDDPTYEAYVGGRPAMQELYESLSIPN